MSDAEPAAPPDFDETMYLQLNPDVAEAVAAGGLVSGRAHYLRYGAREGRRYLPTPGEVREPGVIAVITTRADGSRAPPPPAYWVEAVRMSPGGGVFVTGWIDDATDKLAEAWLSGEDWEVELMTTAFARTRRRDVEQTLGATGAHPYGFWSFVDLGRAMRRHAACRLVLTQASGAGVTLEIGVRSLADSDLRDAVLAWLIECDWSVSAHIGAVAGLTDGAGAQIVAHNRRITAGIVAQPQVERFGPAQGRPKASIIVCLYGRPDYLFLQNALFAGGAGIRTTSSSMSATAPSSRIGWRGICASAASCTAFGRPWYCCRPMPASVPPTMSAPAMPTATGSSPAIPTCSPIMRIGRGGTPRRWRPCRPSARRCSACRSTTRPAR